MITGDAIEPGGVDYGGGTFTIRYEHTVYRRRWWDRLLGRKGVRERQEQASVTLPHNATAAEIETALWQQGVFNVKVTDDQGGYRFTFER